MGSILFTLVMSFINYLILLICINGLQNLEYGSAIAFCVIIPLNLAVVLKLLDKK